MNLVFEHLDEIVMLSPFRCEPCGFYCNWDHEFLDHWRAEHEDGERREGEEEEDLLYWCSFCSFTCADAAGVTAHLLGDAHGEIVAAVSRVVPIVVRRVRVLRCPVDGCDRRFRLRFSLRRHVRRAHAVCIPYIIVQYHYKTEVEMLLLHTWFYCNLLTEQDPSFEPEGQERHCCPHCPYFDFSRRALAAHAFLAHPTATSRHSCAKCRLNFRSRKAYEAHRRSPAHKDIQCNTEEEKVPCDYCGKTQLDLRSHLLQEHARLLSQCGVCGVRFASPQELGAHVKHRCGGEGGIRWAEKFRGREIF